MFIETIPNRGWPPAGLLRESYRDGGGRSRKRALANLSKLPRDVVEGLRALLKGGVVIRTGPDGLAIERSLPHGHVAAALNRTSGRFCGRRRGFVRVCGDLGAKLAAEGWVSYRTPRRAKKLDGLEGWLAERFRRHRGNADVVRQDLAREKGLAVSLRTVERAVRGLRQALRAEARATLRFETPPGHQLQVDFGETRAPIGGERVRLYLFVATLGYSRRIFVRAFRHERQSAWLEGMEAAFSHFGGAPQEVLLDNARALVDRHDAVTREVTFNERLIAFARYWGFRPRACAPYRARTKGKDERGVGYVKSNAIAGHLFISWSALEAHLDWWMREVADQRIHGATAEAPIERFARDEAAALRPLDGGRPSGRCAS